ncbi:hypothetical protein [Algihabitans albus]|uniref:hypothetical protein n=1 Tax=Algihabitans albus TaxID=2164067 RepID=UPI000E5D1100|nr:hypothetical protein [Algihabitans albus]
MTEEELQRQMKLEHYKAQIQLHLEGWKADRELYNLKYSTDIAWRQDAGNVMRSEAMTFAVLALRSLMLFNGAALVILLTLVGAIWSADAEQGQQLITQLHPALKWFGAGVFLGMTSAGVAYLIQQGAIEGVEELYNAKPKKPDLPEADLPEADQPEADQPEADQPEADQPIKDKNIADADKTDGQGIKDQIEALNTKVKCRRYFVIVMATGSLVSFFSGVYCAAQAFGSIAS